MNQTFKDRLREWEGPFDWINGSEIAAEADAQLASKDAEIARLAVEVRRLGGLLKGCEALSDVLRPHADRYLWLRSQPDDTDAPRIDVVHWQVEDESANSGTALRGEELDAAIDVARWVSK